MLTGESRSSLSLLPVASLFDWLGSLRRIDARRRLEALYERAAATRGDPVVVDKVAAALSEAAGTQHRSARRTGDVEAFQRWLGGT